MKHHSESKEIQQRTRTNYHAERPSNLSTLEKGNASQSRTSEDEKVSLSLNNFIEAKRKAKRESDRGDSLDQSRSSLLGGTG
jgi:hypothetical protein